MELSVSTFSGLLRAALTKRFPETYHVVLLFPACDELIPWKVTDSCQPVLMRCLYNHRVREPRISLLCDCLGILTSVFTDNEPKINLTYNNLTHQYPELLFKKNMHLQWAVNILQALTSHRTWTDFCSSSSSSLRSGARDPEADF